MSTGLIILLVVTAIVFGITIALYFLGKRAEKKKAEQDEQVEATAQNVSMLIIDKKKMKLKDAGLPDAIVAQTPAYARISKVPIVKAKVGPKIMTFMCDAQVFPLVPVKKEVKAVVSGIYITSVRGVRGPLETPPKKKKFMDRFKKDNKTNTKSKNKK